MATLDRLGPPATASPPVAAWAPRRAIAVALAIAAAIALLQVVLSSTFTHTGQQLRDLEVRRATLQAQIHEAEAEVAALASLERTEREARDRLGMVPARTTQYVSVSTEAPAGALLPRLMGPATEEGAQNKEPWWRALLQVLPLP
jgi:cell division protein FtsB